MSALILKQMRFGDVKPDGLLDYNVYCNKEIHIVPDKKFNSTVLKADISGESDIETFCNLMFSAYWSCDKACRITADWYNKIATTKNNKKRIDVIKVEFPNGYTFFRFVNGGNWYSFAKTNQLDDSNLFTYRNKENMFALNDGIRWYSPKEDIENNWNFDLIIKHLDQY